MDTILLSPGDNVVVLARSVPAGATVLIEGREFRITEALGLGHKLAASAIRAGESVIKYGAPIGSATHSIEPGEHVHLHNMKSDYLPTFTLGDEREFHAAP